MMPQNYFTRHYLLSAVVPFAKMHFIEQHSSSRSCLPSRRPADDGVACAAVAADLVPLRLHHADYALPSRASSFVSGSGTIP